jgi:hypothetical protein
MDALVRLAVAVDERPTLEQVDAMLAELGLLPRDRTVIGLIDDLLDYRARLPCQARSVTAVGGPWTVDSG